MRPVCTNLLQKLADAHAGFPRDRWRKHGHHFVQQPRLRFHQLGHSLAHNTWQSTRAGSPRAGGGGARRRRTLEGVGVGARDAVPRLRGAPMHVVDRVRIVVLDVPAER